MILEATHFDYSGEHKLYTQELSMLQHRIGGRDAVGPIGASQMPQHITLVNCGPDRSRSFDLDSVDRYPGDTDIMGWCFKEADGDHKLLIVNT